jgi:hypothetical protein
LVIVYAYLLGGFTAFDRLGRFTRRPLARRVFGDDGRFAAPGPGA